MVSEHKSIPESTAAEQAYDCVLIDDDELVRATWRMAAQTQGHRLLLLANAEAFWSRAEHLDRNVPIYVDYRMKTEASGKHLVQAIHDAGFSQLYIETGYPAGEVTPSIRRLLKGVIGKNPPWR